MNPVLGNGAKRRYFCTNYSECLNTTIHRGWPGFSCEHCADYQQEVFAMSSLMDEAIRCFELLSVIVNDDKRYYRPGREIE